MEKLTLGELKKKLERLTLPRVRKETEKIIKNDPSLIERKTAEFKTGSDPYGGIIGEYRSESYRLYKQSLNPLAGGTVDLILTGSTVRNLQVVSLGDGQFKLTSTDNKWGGLVEKYGEKITIINQSVFDGLQKHEYAPKLISVLQGIIR